MYTAKGNQIFVLTDKEHNEEELFLTVHQTTDNPVFIERQAQLLTQALNAWVSEPRFN